MSWYQGKHAFVTGGGSGIGAATAKILCDKGAVVTIAGRGRERLEATAGTLGIDFQQMDVSDSDSVRQGFEAAIGKNGTVDILINNAGFAEAVPFTRLDDDEWQRTLAVNLTGVFACTRAAVPGMLSKGAGRIVNVASTAALTGYAYVSAYCAAKHGVLGLTRSLALEFAGKGITVNAVCPGYTDTDIVQAAIDNISSATGRSREEALAELVASNPQGRLVQPEEVADTIIWLCRQESMNGQAIAIAGGEVM